MLAVLLHGFLGCGADWGPLAGALAGQLPEARVWAPELLKAGSIGAGEEFLSWAQALRAELLERRNGSEPVLVIGYSMGARLALHLLGALATLQPLAGVLISCNPGLTAPEAVPGRRLWEEGWAARFRSSEPWESLLSDWNAQPVFRGSEDSAAPPGEREILAAAMLRWSVTRHGLSLSELAALEMPLLWLVGEQDFRYRALDAEAQERGIPGQRRCIPDAGHRIHRDAPEALARAITAWLQATLSEPPAG